MSLIESNGQATTSTITITTRTDQHIVAKVLGKALRPWRPRLARSTKEFPPGSPRLDVHSAARKHCHVEEQEVEGIRQYQLTSKNRPAASSNSSGRKIHRIYYFNGGGFRAPASAQHWKFVVELVCRMPWIKLYVVSYPLAPKSPAAVTLPALYKYAEAILRDAEPANEDMTLAGDSAGGNLAISIGLHVAAIHAHDDPPCRLRNILTISPAVDMRNTNPAMKAAAEKDVILTMDLVEEVAAGWAASLPRDNTEISPILADLSVLAKCNIKVHGVTGSYDILAPDAILFRGKLDQAGVQGEWLEWEKQMHCFPLAFAPGLVEAEAAVAWIVDVIERNCGVQSSAP